MFLLLILPLLISGYIVFTTHPYHYYRLHRYEGQLLYLESAKIGFFCTLASISFVLLLNFYIPSKLNFFSYSVNIDIYSYLNILITDLAPRSAAELTWLSLITVGSLAIAKFYTLLAKIRLRFKALDLGDFISWRRIKLSFKRKKLLLRTNESTLSADERSKILLMSSILKDSPIDALFFKSYVIDGFYVLLTMEDRKVYIGRVISLGEPNESEGLDQEITITPYASGYRNKDDLSLKLTTKYREVSSDISLTLRQDKIISATHFSEEIFKKFQGEE